MKNTGQTISLRTIIPITHAGKRLDQVLAELFSDYSRARLQEWIRDQCILVDGKAHRPRDRVYGGETITLCAELPPQENWQAQNIALDIVYEDEAILVINKPIGLVVHPAAGNLDRTLLNALLHYAPSLGSLPRAGIVHRLDKDTSGLLVVAKVLAAQTHLVKQLQARSITREYQAIANGTLLSGTTIDEPLGRHPIQRKKMAVLEFGKPAITHFRVLEHFRAHTRISVQLETGRTHQIRVHMAYIQHPLLGDSVYGGRLQLPAGISNELRDTLRSFTHQALHAQRLGLLHPMTGEYIEWQVPVPNDMTQLINALRADATASDIVGFGTGNDYS